MAGTNNSWNNQINGSYNQIILNAGTNGVAISTDNSAATVNVATGGAVKTTTLGSTNTTSVTTVACGTGGCNLGTSANAHATTVGTTTASATLVLNAPAGGLSIGGFTEGALITSSTGVVSTVTGTAGYVLTANAAGTAPSFQAASGGGITTINGDTGSVTGSTVSIKGNGATNAGSSVSFSGSGTAMTLNTTDSSNNIMIGIGAGATLSGSNNNTAIGWHAFNAGFNTQYNTALGSQALLSYTSSGNGGNTATGYGALYPLVNGAYNTGLGYNTGSNYTGAESSNILIGASVGGTNGESNALHIGAGTGTGNGQLNQAFISGITGITVTGAAVLVSTGDQLGVAVSSRKYKENIQDMGSASSDIMSLRPVTFTLKGHEDQSTQFGLIAEEVAEVMPDLVVYDKNGDPQTVQYHELPALLLNELQKALKRIEVLEKKLGV